MQRGSLLDRCGSGPSIFPISSRRSNAANACRNDQQARDPRLRNRGHALTASRSRERQALIPDVLVDEVGVIVDVDLAVVVEITVGPSGETGCEALVDLHIVVDVDLAIEIRVAAVG